MRRDTSAGLKKLNTELAVGLTAVLALVAAGCRTGAPTTPGEIALHRAIDDYRAQRSTPRPAGAMFASRTPDDDDPRRTWPVVAPLPQLTFRSPAAQTSYPTLGTFALGSASAQQAATQPSGEEAPTAKAVALPPEGYWRKDLWHQMGHEAKALGTRDFWRGFKTSYWDLKNILVLSATMGGSIAIRESGVDDTIRNRTHGSRALGDMDETVQILGHPATHFAAAGVLWLGSTLTKDMKEHEVAKTLTQALAVNGVSTLILKGATNTRAPDGEDFAWPSGHTSSAFTAAAVLNEYYGPWVGVPALGLAGLVGFQRLDSRVHDFSDVVFGAVLGYVIGSSMANDGKARFPELFGLQVVPYVAPESGTSGIALMKSW